MLTDMQVQILGLAVIIFGGLLVFTVAQISIHLKDIVDTLSRIDKREQKYRDEWEEEKATKYGFTSDEIRERVGDSPTHE